MQSSTFEPVPNGFQRELIYGQERLVLEVFLDILHSGFLLILLVYHMLYLCYWVTAGKQKM